jgi:hypothetical protein
MGFKGGKKKHSNFVTPKNKENKQRNIQPKIIPSFLSTQAANFRDQKTPNTKQKAAGFCQQSHTILLLPDKKAASSKTVPKTLFLDTKRSFDIFHTNLD